MGCFSFLKLHPHQEEEEANLILKSFELMKCSERMSFFPGLRLIHAPGSVQELPVQRNVQQQQTGRSPLLLRDGGDHRLKWEPLHVLIEKGQFRGKPLPLPAPPRDDDDDDCLVPPLVPKTPAASFSSSVPNSPAWGNKLKCFRFEELTSACQDFSSRCCIREGSFGKVYKCIMHIRSVKTTAKRKMEVAVFRLNETPQQDLEAWIAKVKWISLLQNPNVCKLIGFCASIPLKDERTERLLVFEHCDYGGLDMLLSKSQYIRPLTWSTRVNIAVGAAKGLAYLHDKAYFQVIYTNLTAGNILVDKDFNAKLSDYGLCLGKTTDIKCWDECVLNDVGNFGLVLLELLVGSKNMKRLIQKYEDSGRWISRALRDESKLQVILDSELRNDLQLKSMRRLAVVALKCLRKDLHMRPTMGEVVEELEKMKLQDLDIDSDDL